MGSFRSRSCIHCRFYLPALSILLHSPNAGKNSDPKKDECSNPGGQQLTPHIPSSGPSIDSLCGSIRSVRHSTVQLAGTIPPYGTRRNRC